MPLRRRYGRSVKNFLGLYRGVADEWEVYDNTDGNRFLIGIGSHGQELHESDAIWETFTRSADHAQR